MSEAAKTSTNGHSQRPGPAGPAPVDVPLRAMLESTAVNFVYCDSQMRVLYVNRATVETLDRFSDELGLDGAGFVGEAFDAARPRA